MSDALRTEESAFDCMRAARPGTEIESFAAKRAKVIVVAFRVGALDSGDSLEVVAAGTESFPYFLNALESETTILLGIPFLVPITEIFEVFLEDGVKLISSAGYVFRFGGRCRRDGYGCHIDIYWGE